MKITRAEDITGLYFSHAVIEKGPRLPQQLVVYANAVDGTAKGQATARTLGKAVEELVNRLYVETKAIAFEEQAWRCWGCGRYRPLQGDHIVPRARGARDDRRQNLRGVCHECHRRITDRDFMPIHPAVEKACLAAGWKWLGERKGWGRVDA